MRVVVVVKLGGSLLTAAPFDSILAEIAAASRTVPLLVVPGGGPFADAVRAADRSLGLGDDAAHWMAILAMAAVTYAIRAGGFWLMGYVPLTPRVRSILNALPGSVVVAVI